MIKNITAKAIGTAALLLLCLSASKPSLDGRAVVAESGELPAGLYVKSAAFLPGDTVFITNPAAKVSIEALVFGTFSPAEGIAVVLSPEAAKLLFIAKGSNSIVQITKNGSNTEFSAWAKAFASVPENADKKREPLPEEAKNRPVRATYSELPEKNSDSAEPESVFTPFAAPPPEAVYEEPPVQLAENTADKKSTDPFLPSDMSETESEPVQRETPENGDSRLSPEVQAEIAKLVETMERMQLRHEDDVEKLKAEREAEVEKLKTRHEQEVEQLNSQREDELEKLKLQHEQDVEHLKAAYENSAEAVSAQNEREAPEDEDDEGPEPNVLVPVHDKPPAEPDAENGESIKDVTEVSPVYIAQDKSEQKAAVSQKAAAGRAAIPGLEKYMIDGISSFGAGTYCIQLATYKNTEAISDVIGKYADKYPLRLAKSEKFPDAYRVLIGPLNKDEYPVILKRFASWGFKDAFWHEIH